MSEVNAKIFKQKIVKSNIYVSRTIERQFELNIACRAQVKPPNNKDDTTVLLTMELHVDTENEEIKIEFEADVYFELGCIPEDYNEVAEEYLIPLARTSLLDKLDDILINMGYKEMGLAQRI